MNDSHDDDLDESSPENHVRVPKNIEKDYESANVTDLAEDDLQFRGKIEMSQRFKNLAPSQYWVRKSVDLKNPKKLFVSSDTTASSQMLCHPKHWASLKKGVLFYPKCIKEIRVSTGKNSAPLSSDTLLRYFVTQVEENYIGTESFEYHLDDHSKSMSNEQVKQQGGTSCPTAKCSIPALALKTIPAEARIKLVAVTWKQYRLKAVLKDFGKL